MPSRHGGAQVQASSERVIGKAQEAGADKRELVPSFRALSV